MGLIDIPLHSLKFTWRRNESKSKLDRGLCCNDWLRKFPNLNMLGLKRSFSDHNPLLDKVILKHLQFADDTLIFVPRHSVCITNYFIILDVFAVMSGLPLNYSKSCFISWNSRDHGWAKDIARNVGCLHSKCPFTYLGFPLGDHMNR